MMSLSDCLLKLVQNNLLMSKLVHELYYLIYLLLPRKGLTAEGKGSFFDLPKPVEEAQKDEGKDEDISNADA